MNETFVIQNARWNSEIYINHYFYVVSIGIHLIINSFIPFAYARLGEVPFYISLAVAIFSLFKRYFNHGVLFPPFFLIFNQFLRDILFYVVECALKKEISAGHAVLVESRKPS